jgi:hypothetical protein
MIKLGGAEDRCTRKVHIYKEYHSVCPLVGIGTFPTPSLASECAPPPGTKGGGAHSPAGEGLFRRLEKSLALMPTLWLHSNYLIAAKNTKF